MDPRIGFAAISSATPATLFLVGLLISLLYPVYLGCTTAVVLLLFRRTVTSPAHRIRLCAVPSVLFAPYLVAWLLFHLGDPAAVAQDQGPGPALALALVVVWLAVGVGGLAQVAAFTAALDRFRHAGRTPGAGTTDRSAKAG